MCWADDTAIAAAAAICREGGVVAFPTDTVYGLGGDLFNPRAVERIYAIKGRPAQLPLIAMIEEMAQWPQVAASLPEMAHVWMARWWPGPLTIIVPARPDIPARVLGGGATIGVRIPDHPTIRRLLHHFGRPLATTSANRSGQPAACTATEVYAQLGDEVELILDAGACPRGVPSTVVDCTTTPPSILRMGAISAHELGLAG